MVREVEDPEIAIEDKLMALRALWVQLHNDLCFGLDFLSDRPVGGDSGMLVEVRILFICGLSYFVHLVFDEIYIITDHMMYLNLLIAIVNFFS